MLAVRDPNHTHVSGATAAGAHGCSSERARRCGETSPRAQLVPDRPQGGWIYTGSTHIPEIHGVTFALGHVSGNKRLFLPVRIDFEVNKKRDRVFVEIGYGKKNKGSVQISRCYKEDSSSRTFAKRTAGSPQQPLFDKSWKLHDGRTRELIAHYRRGRPATLY